MSSIMRIVFVAALLAVAAKSVNAETPPTTVPTRYFIVKLWVTDLQRSLDFYRRLGMKEAQRAGVGKGSKEAVAVEAILSLSGHDLESEIDLVYDKNRKTPLEHGNAFWTIAFAVPDVKATVKAIADAGYEVTQQPTDVKRNNLPFATGATYAYVKDPDGYLIELLQWNR